MDGGSGHCTGDRNQDHLQEKEMQKSKMAVLGGLTNSSENNGSKKERIEFSDSRNLASSYTQNAKLCFNSIPDL